MAQTAPGERALLIVGLLNIGELNPSAPPIRLVGIEVVDRPPDLTVSTGAAFDAAYSVCRDWHRSGPAASLRLPHVLS